MVAAMTREEVHKVLTYLVKAGKLQPVEGQTAVWSDVLAGVRYVDAIEACRALARSDREWVSAGDVLGEVRRLRRARIGNREAPAPPPNLSAAEYVAWRRAYYDALGDGDDVETADDRACATIGARRAPDELVKVDVAGLIERGAPRGA